MGVKRNLVAFYRVTSDMPRKYKRTLGCRNYINYTVETLQNAITDIKSGRKSLRRAAEFYNIPRSTLSDKIRGVHDRKAGGQSVLSKDVEKKLVDGIFLSAEWGFPLTEYDIRKIVQNYLNKKGVQIRVFKNNLPGKDWAKSFIARHRTLTLRLAQNIKRNRAEVTNETIKKYFEELEQSLEGIPPENVINYDETNFSDDPGKKKYVCKRGAKHCDRIVDHSKTSISVMMAASGSGELLPPFVVYKAKHRYEEWEENGPPGTRFSISKSGWFEAQTFMEWFRQIAVPYLRQLHGQKVMIGDNLSSHITLEVIEECERLGIRFVLLPPNTTHLCQPLDVAYFAPLKKSWRKILNDWKMRRKGPFQKSDFPSLLQRTLEDINATSKKNIISGFKACGIIPLNPDEVLKRLPDYPKSTTANQVLSDTLLEFLQNTRSPASQPRIKRKRIIEPGRSVAAKDLLPSNRTEEKVGSPDVEDTQESSSVQCEVTQNLEAIVQPERTENDALIIIPVETFVVVKVPISGSQKHKYFVGKVIQQYIEGTCQNYAVSFLRKTVFAEATYFHFPDIEDQSIVARSEIVETLKPIMLRRGRISFSNLPTKYILE